MNRFVPLSVFFLQLDGEDGDDDDGQKKVTGFAEKGAKDPKSIAPSKKPIGKVNFAGDEDGQVKAMKGPRPRAKARKEPPRKEEMTTTANVATYAVPIGDGKPLRRMPAKDRKRWMDRMSKYIKT